MKQKLIDLREELQNAINDLNIAISMNVMHYRLHESEKEIYGSVTLDFLLDRSIDFMLQHKRDVEIISQNLFECISDVIRSEKPQKESDFNSWKEDSI